MKAVFSLIATLPLLAFATPNHNLNAAKNLNAQLQPINALSGTFSQTTKSKGRTQTQNGTFALAKGNKLLWQTTSPAHQRIVSNGKTLWVYDADLKQATRQSTQSQVGDTPAILLSGNATQIAQNFNVTQPDPNKNYYVLYPKQNTSFQNVAISFNKGAPAMMVLNDALGQTTSIRFNAVKVNPKTQASAFEFTPPAGTDIIDQ